MSASRVCWTGLVIIVGCGGAGATSGGATTAAPATSTAATPAEPPVEPSAAPAPVPIEEASDGVRAAWRLVAPMRAVGHAALLETTGGDCDGAISRWHTSTARALAEIERLLAADLALGTEPERAPAHAMIAAAYTQASNDLEAFRTVCLGALDAALSAEQIAAFDTGDVRLDRMQAESQIVFDWRDHGAEAANACRGDGAVPESWRAYCREWWDEGNRPEGELSYVPRSLVAESRASADGTCVRMRIARFSADSYEPPDAARALADATASLAYLREGHAWRALGFRLGERWAAPGDERSDDVDLDDWFAYVAESDGGDGPLQDPLTEAALALPGALGGLPDEPLRVADQYVVFERIARFTPADACGIP